MTVTFTIVNIYPLFNFAMIDSTKALQDQALAVDGPKGDQVDSIELKRLKDDMTSMKKKIMGKSVYFESMNHENISDGTCFAAGLWHKFVVKSFDWLIHSFIFVVKHLNPLSPNIHVQILQTDLHTFPS